MLSDKNQYHEKKYNFIGSRFHCRIGSNAHHAHRKLFGNVIIIQIVAVVEKEKILLINKILVCLIFSYSKHIDENQFYRCHVFPQTLLNIWDHLPKVPFLDYTP